MKKIAILLLAFAIPGATCADESVRDGWRWGTIRRGVTQAHAAAGDVD
jgi:hypothetical protein